MTDNDSSVPDEREVLAPVQPVPVVSVSQLKVVVSASMARVRLPSGTVKAFHLREEAVRIVQVNSPVELVKVHPVEPDPPPSKISPVAVLLRFKAPLPLASRLKAMLVSEPVAA